MRRLYWTLSALGSHWRRHPVQLFSVLAGLWLATSLWAGVQALNSQARDSYARASQLLGGADRYSLVARRGGLFPQHTFVALRCAAPAGRSRRCCRGACACAGRPSSCNCSASNR